jgi:ABC-type transporter Mla subunit MlaD
MTKRGKAGNSRDHCCLGIGNSIETMDERVAQFRVGVMVLATIIITGILILLFNRFPALGQGSYVIHVRFPTAPGVAKDTPVRRSGILIGRVTDVEFDDDYNVIVTLRIDGDQTVFKNDEIRISRSLLGDAQIEVMRPKPSQAGETPPPAPGSQSPAGDQDTPPSTTPNTGNDVRRSGEAHGPFNTAVLHRIPSRTYLLAVLQPQLAQQQKTIRDAQPAPAPAAPPRRAADVPVPEGATVQGRVGAGPLESLEALQDDFKRAAEALTAAGGEVGGLARNLNQLLGRNEQQIERIISQADRALSSFELAMNSVNDILGDPELRDNLKRTLRDLPTLLQQTQQAIGSIEGAMRLVDSNLRNLEGFTGPLGQRGDAIVGNIDSSIAQLNQLLAQLELFSRSLNSREGTLGQLINNREIYDQLNMAAANVNDLTKELRPIVEDVRIFTDKISRHPGVILRDAVKPGSGTKWVTGHE